MRAKDIEEWTELNTIYWKAFCEQNLLEKTDVLHYRYNHLLEATLKDEESH